MTTLYPKQDEHAKRIYRALLKNGAALDTSETGTGKTITSAHIAAHWTSLGKPVGVVCPKVVVTNWERTLQSHGVCPEFVLNYDKLRNGRPDIVRIKRQQRNKKYKRTDKWYQWLVPEDTLLIFDEVQYCKGHCTQNGNLLIAAKQAGYHTLSLSATAAADPTEMRALGYALGLHDLNDMRNNRCYFRWLQSNGCSKDPWGTWHLRKSADLSTLRHQMFDIEQIAHGLKTSDMPGAFQNQNIVTDLGDYKGAADCYEQAGLTQDVVATLLGDISAAKDKATLPVVDILRARQYVEALKVTHFIEQTNELLAEGKSVIAFFNFRDSIETYRKAFPESGVIIGEQPDRDQHIDAWANDETRVLAVSAAAGGTGVSLHDVRGEFPRVTLISPDFSVQTYKQVLGRAFRAGMKTDLQQRVVIAADTIEEYVHQKCMEGVRNMESMLG